MLKYEIKQRHNFKKSSVSPFPKNGGVHCKTSSNKKSASSLDMK